MKLCPQNITEKIQINEEVWVEVTKEVNIAKAGLDSIVADRHLNLYNSHRKRLVKEVS